MGPAYGERRNGHTRMCLKPRILRSLAFFGILQRRNRNIKIYYFAMVNYVKFNLVIIRNIIITGKTLKTFITKVSFVEGIKK